MAQLSVAKQDRSFDDPNGSRKRERELLLTPSDSLTHDAEEADGGILPRATDGPASAQETRQQLADNQQRMAQQLQQLADNQQQMAQQRAEDRQQHAGSLQQMTQQLQRLAGDLQHIALQLHNIDARHRNSAVRLSNEPLAALHDANGNTPPNFPADSETLDRLPSHALRELFAAYQLPFPGRMTARKIAFRQFLGLLGC
jgi:hypothetical protein